MSRIDKEPIELLVSKILRKPTELQIAELTELFWKHIPPDVLDSLTDQAEARSKLDAIWSAKLTDKDNLDLGGVIEWMSLLKDCVLVSIDGILCVARLEEVDTANEMALLLTEAFGPKYRAFEVSVDIKPEPKDARYVVTCPLGSWKVADRVRDWELGGSTVVSMLLNPIVPYELTVVGLPKPTH